MKRKLSIAVAIVTCLAGTGANAQLGGLLGKLTGVPSNGEAGGAYQSNNQIRTYITTGAYAQVDRYGKVITKAAEMTRDKGFSRFGVTKHVCTTTLMNNNPVASSCYVIAIMLNGDEQAKARGDREVLYYAVEDVLAGKIARPGSGAGRPDAAEAD